MGVFLFILAVVLMASWLEKAELNHLKKDYEEWKRNRK
jgi:hypothetical protein